MDKSWIWNNDKLSEEYTNGVAKFIEIAGNHLDNRNKTRCPCIDCVNQSSHDLETVQRHLWFKGFSRHYMNWTHHGEEDDNLNNNNSEEVVSDTGEDDEGPEDNDDMIPALQDAVGVPQGSDQNETTVQEEHHIGVDKFKELLEESQKELYLGCKEFSSLTFTVKLMHMKVLNNWSNKSFDMFLQLIGEAFPFCHNLPRSYYEAKRMLRNLGLGYETIHVCKNDCALFWKEHKDATQCPICEEPRYKMNSTEGKKIPQKKMYYFRITPRLQRLFMSRHTCDNMRWHKEERVDTDGVLRHPADAEAWKEFDKEYSWFAQDPKNVRLGLATDGFNPFGNLSTNYSVWPVLLVPYNMPSWRCMKEMFYNMAILISDANSPGSNIDVYLQPLIDELKELWKNGVKTYDVSKDDNFMMHAAVLWTINDFSAYGTLSGWSTRGYKACPVCNEDTSSIGIRDKVCYIEESSSCKLCLNTIFILQKRSKEAAKNKKKMLHTHRAGSKSFIGHRTKESSDDSVMELGRIELFEKTHFNAKHGWINEEVETRYKQMVELKEQRQENNKVVDENAICAEILGSERNGYIPGLRPISRKGHSTKSSSQVEAQIQQRVADMAEQMRMDFQRERDETTTILRDQLRSELLMEMRKEMEIIMNRPDEHPFYFQSSRQPPPPPPPPPAPTV